MRLAGYHRHSTDGSINHFWSFINWEIVITVKLLQTGQVLCVLCYEKTWLKIIGDKSMNVKGYM